MAYAVVTFNNNEVSEVPANWLETNDDEPSCWWPTNCKKISTLIAKKSEPDKKSWDNSPVTIEKYCTSLEEARKIAEDANDIITDNDQLGKGYRKVIPNKRISSSSFDAKNENENQCDIDEEAENVDDPYMIPSPVAMSETRKKEHFSEISTLIRKIDGMHVVDRNQEEYSRIIIQMLESIQIQLQELHQKIGREKPMFTGNVNLVEALLPLKSTKGIETFEKIISLNPEIKEQFNTFVREIEGHTAREKTQKICTQIFTNSCAELCSWKGRKGYFCIEGLRIIKIMQDAILHTYPITKETEFEEIVAEWFAKQRRIRKSIEK